MSDRPAARKSASAHLRATFRAVAVAPTGTRMTVSIMESGVVYLGLPPGFDDPMIRRTNSPNGVALVVTPPSPPGASQSRSRGMGKP